MSSIRFSKLGQDGEESDVRYLDTSNIRQCPHVIIDPEHYREDGSCKCNDKNEVCMAEWGYVWDEKLGRWSV